MLGRGEKDGPVLRKYSFMGVRKYCKRKEEDKISGGGGGGGGRGLSAGCGLRTGREVEGGAWLGRRTVELHLIFKSAEHCPWDFTYNSYLWFLTDSRSGT